MGENLFSGFPARYVSNIEIMHRASLITIQIANNKGFEPAALMGRLICAFVVRLQQSGFLVFTPIY